MRQKPSVVPRPEIHAARIAWWASFSATVALIVLLGLARSAQALTVPASNAGAVVAAAPLSDEDELEDEAEVSEDEEFEDEECEDDEVCEDDEEAAGPEAPEECLLSSASASVSASADQDKVRLTIRYKTFSPATVTVGYWLRGSRGPLNLGNDRDRFGRAGVFRRTESLNEAQMTKVLAARDFTIELHAVNAPRYCDRLLDRHLTIKRAAAGGLTWSDPEASLRR